MGYRQPPYRLAAIREAKRRAQRNAVIAAGKRCSKKYSTISSIKATFETVIADAVLQVTPKIPKAPEERRRGVKRKLDFD